MFIHFTHPNHVSDGLQHAAWTAPLQISICLIILCVQLGPSALAGFALFVVAMPIQAIVMSGQLRLRRTSVIWTEKRAKLLLEVLSSMRIVKYFTYEQPFLKRAYFEQTVAPC